MTELSGFSARTQRLLQIAAGIVVGGALGLIAGLFLLPNLGGRESITPLTTAAWNDARERWRQSGVRDYDLRVSVSGPQAATYAVTVRDGATIQATRDGMPLPQQRTWSTWTVEGMFETIARDLESVEKHTTRRADSNTPQLQLHATFHEQLGYPERYLRTEFLRFAPNREVSWTVVAFTRPDSPDDGHQPATAP